LTLEPELQRDKTSVRKTNLDRKETRKHDRNEEEIYHDDSLFLN
jgi:hypothetical protein